MPEELRRRIACFPQAVSATLNDQSDSTGTDLSAAGVGAITVECVELDEVLKTCAHNDQVRYQARAGCAEWRAENHPPEPAGAGGEHVPSAKSFVEIAGHLGDR
jgi:hypothetical protein